MIKPQGCHCVLLSLSHYALEGLCRATPGTLHWFLKEYALESERAAVKAI